MMKRVEYDDIKLNLNYFKAAESEDVLTCWSLGLNYLSSRWKTMEG